MSRGVSDKITFKPYSQEERWLLPPSLDELIPQNHLVRTVSKTVDELNIEKIFAKYTKGGGASRYNPVMLLKVMIYCYMTGVYSSRQIAKQCRENINVMWLAGNQTPDFRTINKFRGEKLKDAIEEIFISTVKLLNIKGFVSLEKYFVDGTKVESASNKYTFVWKKAVEKNEKKLDEKLRVFLKDVEEITDVENREYGNKDLAEVGEDITVTSEEIKAVADKINKKLDEIADSINEESKDVKKKLKKAKRLIEKDYLPRKEKYEKANATFNGRNSYSKTDEDATFMRMKEDAMLNGQLKPGYNIQVGTENNFVIGYDVFPNPTDTRTLKPHLENVMNRLDCKFETIIADAGYGSEENYDYLEENGITGAIKYSTYEKETKRSFKKKTFNFENWNYDSNQKLYTCPTGNPVPYKKNGNKEKSFWLSSNL
ncbi:IS1182 family transposase [uncultured Treponema sp.]|uniref:IS1182 family transposase n=1 Tax=uncultured Treponema sp. TaxID=162155 RepID=UPI0025946A54|nr:IS1182 family transposase [uncultured Treponema sp.]